MSMARNLVAGFVAALCLAGIGSVASAQNANPAAARQCAVTVDRTRDAGVFSVTRQELSNGNCVCNIQTGPVGQAASVEGQIASMTQGRSCGSARVVRADAANDGGLSGGEVALAGGVLAGMVGVIVAIESGESDDLPVSP